LPSFPPVCQLVKPFFEADKKTAIELWKAKIPQKNIGEKGLKNNWAHAKKHPKDPLVYKNGGH
jgi:hypothetical protein